MFVAETPKDMAFAFQTAARRRLVVSGQLAGFILKGQEFQNSLALYHTAVETGI
jgi:hypothetical protein